MSEQQHIQQVLVSDRPAPSKKGESVYWEYVRTIKPLIKAPP